VALIDLDDLRRLNDEYGRRAGDEVLRELADLLPQIERRDDCVGRQGGGEFALILKGAGEAGARKILERLSGVWTARTPLTTFSAGIAVHDGRAPTMTVERADAALYRARRSGSGRIEGAPPIEESSHDTVLLIEENRAARLALVDTLSIEGYHVVATAERDAALRQLHTRGAVGLILLDPGSSQLEAERISAILRTEPALASIPLVVLSGADRIAELAHGLGAVAWFPMPPPIPELLDCVARYCRPARR
jgi:diguanylate cyclase (GGDEF)-like protein